LKSFLKFVFLAFFIGLIALPILVLVLSTDNTATVTHNKPLSFDNIKKAKQIIKDNRPQRFFKGQIKKVSVTEDELNLLISYAIFHGLGTKYLFAKTQLADNMLKGFLTIQIPRPLSGHYINCRATFNPKNNFLELNTFHVGRIKFPKLMTKPIISFVHTLLLKTRGYGNLWQNAHAIKNVTITEKRITLFYTLNYVMLKALKEQGRSFLMPDEHQKKLIKYHNHLSKLTQTYSHKNNAILELIKGTFAFAAENSKTSGNPILENTTALQVLSLYAIGQRLDRLLKKDYRKDIKSTVRTKLLFHNRTDLPKHFLVSAALTVSTGSKFANLVGLAKEIEDSDGGSGFSFADLAADKAGVKFGELAIESTQKAIRFQKKLSLISDEIELVPSISNLPEGIMELEFKSKYIDLDSIAYKLIDIEIDKRLKQCRLYWE